MRVVADSNIFLAVVLNEPEKETIIRLTEGTEGEVIAPEILPYEVGNALAAMVKRGRLSRPQAFRAFEAVGSIPVRLVDVDISRSLEIALEHKIYAYDAYFLECARRFSCPILTLDKSLKRVAGEMKIEVLE